MSTELIGTFASIPAMSDAVIERVRALEEWHLSTFKQPDIDTSHVFHAGIYARTIILKAGLQMTGCLIRIPTLLMIGGDCYVTLGDDVRRVAGNAVIQCSAMRKSAFLAIADTMITMSFATKATTVEEAEAEFTNEAERLMSRKPGARNVVTGERV